MKATYSIAGRGTDEQLKALRDKKLAEEPESLGVRGWMTRGMDKERMAAIAAEIEERENTRINPTGKKEKGQMAKPREGAQKEARPIPEVITNRWIWTARRREMEAVLHDRLGVADDLSGKDLTEIKRMIASWVREKKGRSPKKKAAPPAPDTNVRKKETIPAGTETRKGNGGTNGAGMETVASPLSLFCMRCGFHMEVHQPEEFMKRQAGGGK